MSERSIPTLYPLKFWGRIGAFSAVVCLVGVVILRWVFMKDMGETYAGTFYRIQDMIGYLAPMIAFSFLLVLMIGSLAVFVVAMIASHQIAGPLFRLQRVGDYLGRMILVGKIHLRESDWIKPVSRDVNEWVEKRKESYEKEVLWAALMDSALRDMKLLLAAGKPDMARAVLDEMLEAEIPKEHRHKE